MKNCMLENQSATHPEYGEGLVIVLGGRCVYTLAGVHNAQFV